MISYFAMVSLTHPSPTELSIAPNLNGQLVPAHIKPVLAAKGLDIDNLTPLTRDQMMARLD